jgi:hypothetical protein
LAKQTIPSAGLWSSIAAILNGNFSQPSFGVYDYNDAATAITPIVFAPDVWVDLTNDGLGDATNKIYAHPDIPDVWDTVSNSFDFKDLELGDTLDIRLDVDVTTTAQNQVVDIALFVNSGGAGEYVIPFIVEAPYKSSGAREVIRWNGMYMGDANTKDNPAKFMIRSDSGGSVVVNGWYCRVSKRV